MRRFWRTLLVTGGAGCGKTWWLTHTLIPALDASPPVDGRPRVWFHAVGRVRRGCGHAKIPRTYDTRIEHGGMLREKHAPMFFGNRTILPPHTHRVMRGYGVTATSLP